MKHYGKFLPFVGRPVEYRSNDIERLLGQKAELLSQLERLDEEIKEQEMAFIDFIKEEWTSEEIREAQEKADEYNNKKRIQK